MVFPKARATIAGLLFLGWLGFLAYLVVQSRDPIVLSRPQFLVATAVVIAEVHAEEGKPAPTVTQARVAWSATASPGATFAVANLTEVGPDHGWQGPGNYILPLVSSGGRWIVPPIPAAAVRSPRIYPLTAQTQAQLDALVDAKRPAIRE